MYCNKEVFHQTLAVLTVVLNELSLSMGSAWVSPTLGSLQSSDSLFSLTIEECSWIASLEHIGKIVGAFISAKFLDVVGRKFILSLCASIFFLIWLPILFTRSVIIIYIVRIAFGMACGMNDSSNSVYLGEISSPFIRGLFGTLVVAISYFGIVLGLVVPTYFSYQNTALINSVIEFISFLSIFWMVEPVQYLLMKRKFEQAKKNFLWLKGEKDSEEMKSEFEKIKQNAFSEISKKSSYLKVLKSPANYKSLSMMLTIYALTGANGYFPIMSHAFMLLPSTDILTPNEFTIFLGIFQFIAAASSSATINQFNRRSMIMISFSFLSLIHAFTALLYFLQENVIEIPYFRWLIFATIAISLSIYSYGYPAVFLIRSELFPLSVRALGGCTSIMAFAVTNFLTTKIFLYILHNYGIYYNFILFSNTSLILVLFVYCVLPETRNKSLIEIQEVLEKEN